MTRQMAKNLLWSACQHIDVFSRGTFNLQKGDLDAISLMRSAISRVICDSSAPYDNHGRSPDIVPVAAQRNL